MGHRPRNRTGDIYHLEVFVKYIRVYDNVIDKDFCDLLIKKFHSNRQEWLVRDNDTFKFNEINLPNSQSVFGEEMNKLYSIFESYVDQYIRDCGIQSYQFPESYGFEEMRMKHYKAGHGEFRPHVDSTEGSWKRFLVFFLYLDEGPGGQTVFYDHKTLCERKPGRLLMFPPTWTYPHAGLMPQEVDKHIIGSYLHYTQ